MRDGLPAKIYKSESGIVNLDNTSNPGTHWVCYRKKGDKVQYYDSFGNLRPPIELIKYFRSAEEHRPLSIQYNYDRYQDFSSVNCGHLCLQFLLQK